MQSNKLNMQSNKSNTQSFHDLELSNISMRELVKKYTTLDYSSIKPIDIVPKNEQIDWYHNYNHNPNAIPIILYKHDYNHNPNAIPIILYKHDYDDMKKKMQPLAEELSMYVFHPLRMNRIAERNNIPFDELINDIY